MKKFSFILRVISSALVILLALVFTVLEVTLLVTLDFALYENGLLAFVQLFLKLLIAATAGALGVLSLLKPMRAFLSESICLLAASAVMIPFMINSIGIYVTAVSALFMLSQLLSFKIQK